MSEQNKERVDGVENQALGSVQIEGTNNYQSSEVIVDSTYSTKFLYKYTWANT